MARDTKELQFRELKDTISQLNITITAQTQLIASLQKSLDAANEREAEQSKQLADFKEQIDFLTKKLFGASSERRMDDVEGQLHLFNEAETLQKEAVMIPDIESTVKAHTRKAKTTLEEKIKGIPVEEILVDLSEEEKICPQCNTQLKLIGRETIRHEIEYIPAQVKVKKYVSLHYGCPECKETEEPYIIKAKTEQKPLMKHSLASSSSVAWTMYQKYANGMPLYRQEKDWKQYGIELSRSTFANWIIYNASQYLDPLYEYFHRCLLKRKFLMADETTT